MRRCVGFFNSRNGVLNDDNCARSSFILTSNYVPAIYKTIIYACVYVVTLSRTAINQLSTELLLSRAGYTRAPTHTSDVDNDK